MSTRVVLVQGCGVMRAGLRALIERDGQFSVVGEAASQGEALQICKADSPDLVLIDFSLTQLNGIATITQILCDYPQIRVVILSAGDCADAVTEAFRSGARAFVLRGESGSTLLEVMDVVSKGGFYLSIELHRQLLQRVQSRRTELDGQSPELESLSPRELEVLRLVASGQSTKDVAVTIGLTIETVRSYRKTMMKKLRVSNVAVLTAFAITNGIVNTGATDPKSESSAA
jgi:DNA-binding NarL/FixJ family response regulator